MSERATARESELKDFKCLYLYGFTNNPFLQSQDFPSFNKLYDNVIGKRGGIIIGSSFHPYQLINQKGATAWQLAFLQIALSDQKTEALEAISNQQARYYSNPAVLLKDVIVWPDTRLTFQQNPIFSKYVPFVYPFLVHNTKTEIKWYDRITEEMAQIGHASAYVESVTQNLRFLLPEPSFVLGLEEFDEGSPSKLIDVFINAKPVLSV
jgi:hypothetical protein